MAVEIAGIAERRWRVLGAGAAILAVAIVTVLISIAYRRDIDQAFKRISTGK